MFEDGIAIAAVWRVVDSQVALRSTQGGGNMPLSRVGASPGDILWNKVSAPTCRLCASGRIIFLLREASHKAVLLTACLCLHNIKMKTKLTLQQVNIILERKVILFYAFY